MDFIGNRASDLFKKAIVDIDTKESILFTYFDTYKTQFPKYDESKYDKVLKLIERKYTNPIDNKRQFGHRFNGTDIAPLTYFNKTQVINIPNKLWFIKDPNGAGGASVTCVKSEDIMKTDIPNGYIIQEGLTDLSLIDNKKYTIRMYLLIWNNNLYLYKSGFCVVHGVEYNPTNSSYETQIKHSGYTDSDSKIYLLEFDKVADHGIIFGSIIDKIKIMKQHITDIINRSDEYTYSILGIDIIPLRNKDVKIIEINTYPNFIHTDSINKSINIPMMHETIALMLGENLKNGLNYLQI